MCTQVGVLGSFRGIDAFEFEEGDVWVGPTLSALERNVLCAHIKSVGGAVGGHDVMLQ